MGILPFISMSDNTGDAVELQAGRTAVTSAGLGYEIKLKMAQESKLAQSVTCGQSKPFTQLHFFLTQAAVYSFFSKKMLSEKKFSVVPKEGSCWQWV